MMQKRKGMKISKNQYLIEREKQKQEKNKAFVELNENVKTLLDYMKSNHHASVSSPASAAAASSSSGQKVQDDTQPKKETVDASFPQTEILKPEVLFDL